MRACRYRPEVGDLVIGRIVEVSRSVHARWSGGDRGSFAGGTQTMEGRGVCSSERGSYAVVHQLARWCAGALGCWRLYAS